MFLNKNFIGKFFRSNSYFFFFAITVFISSCFLVAEELDSFLGPRVNKNTLWVGNQIVSSSISILVMAGHADSQDIPGEGTSGEAVALKGLSPMDPSMSDELFWNLKVRDNVVKVGKIKGLNINAYDPKKRTIIDENDSKTNWSIGSVHAAQGGYVLEIHFDSYGRDGLGSGLIPPLSRRLNNIDESLAQSFGRYPLFFRGGLGAPRREIRILEVGKLEGNLETSLRDQKMRQMTLDRITNKIVDAILRGITKQDNFNQMLQEGDIFLPNFYQ